MPLCVGRSVRPWARASRETTASGRATLGARRSDIVRQFLIETILISFVGGTIGVLVGVGMSRLIGVFAGWSTIVTTSSILLAFLVSVTVGLVFGLYPARRAAHLDPIEALRYE